MNEDRISKLRYKTPFFLFDTKKLISNYLEFNLLFPNSRIHYAMKANSEPKILKALMDQGSGFEVASMHELNMLKRIGVKPHKIVYGTSVKPHSHIEAFYRYGVDTYAADSQQELDKISIKAPGSKIYIRTKVNDSGSVFKFSEKFGAETDNIVNLLIHAKRVGLKPYGISFHVGSQAGDQTAWSKAILGLKPIIMDLGKKGIQIKVLNIGGGYPCKYASSEIVPELKDIAKSVHDAVSKLPANLKLMLEPGRGMVADTGVLVTSVIARLIRKDSSWLFLDAGVYNGLFETMAYQGSTRYAVTSLRPIGNQGASLFALAGPTGDSADVITREALLPADIGVGDKLVFHNAGAYSLSVTSQFNGFPKPSVRFI